MFCLNQKFAFRTHPNTFQELNFKRHLILWDSRSVKQFQTISTKLKLFKATKSNLSQPRLDTVQWTVSLFTAGQLPERINKLLMHNLSIYLSIYARLPKLIKFAFEIFTRISDSKASVQRSVLTMLSRYSLDSSDWNAVSPCQRSAREKRIKRLIVIERLYLGFPVS